MNNTKSRILLIDLCRGILVLMMTARHTISILDFNAAHWLYKYFLPKGWATVCFISLSGFSIGMLYLDRMRNPTLQNQTASRLRIRSWQIFVVMFVSNLFMLISKFILSGDFYILLDPEWWLGLVTLRTPYSISSILIPTAILVFITPEILKLIVRWKVLPVLAISLLLALGTALIAERVNNPEELYYFVRRFLFEGDGFFSILPMVFYGLISIAIGALWQQHMVPVVISNLAIYYAITLFSTRSASARIIFAAINGPARLIIVNLVCLAVMKLSFLGSISNFFATIGRFSLLSFLLHRILLQAFTVILNIIQPKVSIEVVYFIMVSVNLACIWLICASRLRYPKWNAFLRSIYL